MRDYRWEIIIEATIFVGHGGHGYLVEAPPEVMLHHVGLAYNLEDADWKNLPEKPGLYKVKVLWCYSLSWLYEEQVHDEEASFQVVEVLEGKVFNVGTIVDWEAAAKQSVEVFTARTNEYWNKFGAEYDADGAQPRGQI